jgi:hypothetical protein
MNWAWASSLGYLWRSPAFPMWLTLAAAGFFAIIVLITLLRAEKSVANGALTVITLLAVGIAVAATFRVYGPASRGETSGENRPPAAASAALPALACVDDLAGDTVLSACEKALFGSAEATAAAVSYAASQLTWLTALGDVAAANKNLTYEVLALRHAVERDRYGLVAQVLMARDHCTPTQCVAFRSLTDQHQIAANMEEHVYDAVVARYAPSWNAPPVTPGSIAALGPSMPTGKPTNAEFPSAASTPPVSIMTPEPGTGTATTPSAARPASPATNATSSLLSPRPTASTAPSSTQGPASAQAAAKKPPAPKPRAPGTAAPARISPAAPAPAASND